MFFRTLTLSSLIALVACTSKIENPADNAPLEIVTVETDAPSNNNPSVTPEQEPAPEQEPTPEQEPEEVPENETPAEPEEPAEPVEPLIDENLFSGLPTGAEQLQNICNRGNDNAVTRAFCGANTPNIESITALQNTLGFDFNEEVGEEPAFAITAHSSSLVSRSVSALNPRTIVFNERRNDRDDDELVAIGFTRGDQFAEIMTFTEGDDDQEPVMSFYLLTYKRPCDNTEAGCDHADKFLPEVERDWTEFTLYEDVDLKNTVVDCLQCHQPNGPGTQKILRMQELQDPWNHWMRDNREMGQRLIADFQAVHVNEDFGGIPADRISDSDPADLERFIEEGEFEDMQINEYDSDAINDDLEDTNDMWSDTWSVLYERAVAGEVIPPPFFGASVADPVLLNLFGEAYIDAKAGVNRELLPNLRDVISAQTESYMSVRPKEGLDGRGILTHMCAQCHNSRLDQDISRARFDVTNLDSMSREQKDKAIERLQLPRKSRLAMPPDFFKELSDEEIDLAVQALQQ